jgi:hypothetical protein
MVCFIDIKTVQYSTKAMLEPVVGLNVLSTVHMTIYVSINKSSTNIFSPVSVLAFTVLTYVTGFLFTAVDIQKG